MTEPEKHNVHPLHDLANKNESLLLYSDTSIDAILATSNSSTVSRPAEEGSLVMRAERRVKVYPYNVADGYISETIRKLAHHLHEDEIIDKHLDVFYKLEKES